MQCCTGLMLMKACHPLETHHNHMWALLVLPETTVAAFISRCCLHLSLVLVLALSTHPTVGVAGCS